MPVHLIAMIGLALAIEAIRKEWIRGIGVLILCVILGLSSYGYYSYHKKEDWKFVSQSYGIQQSECIFVFV